MLPKIYSYDKRTKKNPLLLTCTVGLSKTHVKWWTKFNANLPLGILSHAVMSTTAVKTVCSMSAHKPGHRCSTGSVQCYQQLPCSNRGHSLTAYAIASNCLQRTFSGHSGSIRDGCLQADVSKLRSRTTGSADGENPNGTGVELTRHKLVGKAGMEHGYKSRQLPTTLPALGWRGTRRVTENQ